MNAKQGVTGSSGPGVRVFSRPTLWLHAHYPALLLVGVATYFVFYDGVKKLSRAGVTTGVFGVVDQVSVVGLAAVAFGAVVVLVYQRRFVWPLGLFLAFVTWGYARGVGGSDWVWVWVVEMAAVMITFFAVDRARKNLTPVLLLYPAMFLGASIIFAVFFTEPAFRFGWGSDFFGELPYGLFMGIAGHPNHFGVAMAFGLLVVLAQPRITWVMGGSAVLLAVGLVWSGSDGAMVSFVVGAAAMVITKDVLAGKPGRIPWRSIGVGAAGVVFAIVTTIIVFSRGVNEFTSGRDNIWQSFVDPAFQAGFLGLGAHPRFITRYPELFNETATEFTDPHNTLLMVQLTTGFVGTGLYVLMWVAVAVAIWKRTNGVYRTLAVGLSVFLLVHGLVESHIFGGVEYTDLLYAALIAMLVKNRRPQPLITQRARARG